MNWIDDKINARKREAEKNKLVAVASIIKVRHDREKFIKDFHELFSTKALPRIYLVAKELISAGCEVAVHENRTLLGLFESAEIVFSPVPGQSLSDKSAKIYSYKVFANIEKLTVGYVTTGFGTEDNSQACRNELSLQFLELRSEGVLKGLIRLAIKKAFQ